jgi:hypothetical protein
MGEEFVGAGELVTVCVAATGPADDPQSMADARHIALWDPQAVLQLVAAIRKIIQLHNLARELRPELPPSPTLAVLAEGFDITQEPSDG